MKKLLIVVMVLALTLTGCGIRKISYDNGEKVKLDKFIVIEKLDSMGNGMLYIMYDKDTKVEYYYLIEYNRAAMSPIYNTDGSVKVYEGE